MHTAPWPVVADLAGVEGDPSVLEATSSALIALRRVKREVRGEGVAAYAVPGGGQILGVVATPFTMLTTHQNAPEAYPSLTSYAADH